MTGNQWEAHIAKENQQLAGDERALLVRIPTHMHGGIPWAGHKVDFMGLLSGGRFVALEAKANSGSLTAKQRLLLAWVARLGGVALVYRFHKGERHLCAVNAKGKQQRKSKATLCLDGETWLDAWERMSG